MIRQIIQSVVSAMVWLSFIATVIAAAPPPQASTGDVYIVQAEDWLSKIAEKYYGDILAYPAIVAATNAKASSDASFAYIANPDFIEVGQKLWIPADHSTFSSTAPAQEILTPVAELNFLGATFLAFSSDDQLLALGNLQEIQVWNTQIWQLGWSAPIADGLESVAQVAFSPDSQRLALVGDAGYANGRAYLWEANTGQLLNQLHYDRQVWSLDFSADSHLWATGSLDGKVILADAVNGQPIKEFNHGLGVQNLALSPTGPWLAVMLNQDWGPAQVMVWDTLTEEQRSLAEFRLWAYSNVAFSPDGQWLAAGLAGDERVVAIWQTQTWPEVARLDVKGGIIDQLEFSSDGRLLAGLESFDERSKRIWVWEVPGWRLVSKMELPNVSLNLAPSPICAGPCNRWLTFGLKQGTEQPPTYEVQLWDVVSGAFVAQMPFTYQLVFSHNGQRIATGGEVVKVWELVGEK